MNQEIFQQYKQQLYDPSMPETRPLVMVIPQKIRKAAYEQAKRLFSPLLRSHGFHAKGKVWSRIQNGICLQAVSLDFETQRKIIVDIPVRCYVRLLTQPGLCEDLVDSRSLLKQQALNNDIHPNALPCSYFVLPQWIVTEQKQLEYVKHFPKPQFTSQYLQRRESENHLDAMRKEYEYFQTHTLPLMNTMGTPQGYMSYLKSLKKPQVVNTVMIDPQYIHCLLMLRDWDAVMDCIRLQMQLPSFNSSKSTFEEMTSHVLQHDETWVQVYLQNKIEKNKLELIRMKYLSSDFKVNYLYEKQY